MRFSIALFLMVVSLTARGQWVVEKVRVAPSPDAASLGTYINFPVANSSGLVPITIPLSELSTDMVKMPVNLSYHGGGVPVEREASSVGLNWSLNCGGVITRSVRGSADDINQTVIIDGSMHYRRYWGWIDQGKSIPVGFPNSYWSSIYGGTPEQKAGYVIAYIDPVTAIEVEDTEPDIFYINVGTIQSKFVFDNNGVIRFLGDNDYKVTFARNGTGPYLNCTSATCGIRQFTVTDHLGTQYIFDQVENTHIETDDATFYNYQPAQIFTVVSEYSTAWFLSKVKSPNGKEINFTYETVTIKQSPPVMQSRKACVEGRCAPSSGNVAAHRTTITTKLLSAAYDPYLKLTASTGVREDLEGARRINAIAVNSIATGKNLKTFNLNYFYTTPPTRATGNPYKDKRLFLSKVYQVDGSANVMEYALTYDRPTMLPAKSSAEQDFWGYYNANNAEDLIPSLYVYPALGSSERYKMFPMVSYPGNQVILPGWNRAVQPAYVTMGSLIEIKFPTKGKVRYTFESNEFIEPGSAVQKGGGIRIAAINYLDYTDKVVARKAYGYSLADGTSSGLLTSMPRFARESTYGPNPLKSQNGQPAIIAPTAGFTAYFYHTQANVFNAERDLSEFDLWNIFTERFCYSRTPLSDLDGQQVAYTQVRISELNNGEVVHEYHAPRTFRDNPTLVNTAASTNTGSFIIQIPGAEPGISVCAHNVFGKIETTGYNIFPFPPASMNSTSFLYGKIKSSRLYDASGTLKQRKDYEYVNHSSVGAPVEILAFTFQMHDAVCEDFGIFRSPLIPHAWAIYKYYAGADALTKREIITFYENGASLVTFKEYNYDPSYTQPKSIAEKRSDGSLLTTEFTYPIDYHVQPEWAGDYESGNYDIVEIRELASRNIYTPLEVVKYLNKNSQTTVVDATFNKYKLFNEKFVPSQKSRLSKEKPLTDFVKSYIDGTPYDPMLHLDTRYELEHTVEKYNTGVSPIQETDRSMTYAYIYGYNDRYLTAMVKNAAVNQIYYNSFEEEVSNYATTGKTGAKSRTNGFTKDLTGLTPGTYKLTYWKSQGSGWEFVSQDVTITSSTYTISLMGIQYIDELRFYPVGAEMTTYCYDPGMGTTCITDANGASAYYEYDTLGRLKLIRDTQGNIVKRFEYSFLD